MKLAAQCNNMVYHGLFWYAIKAVENLHATSFTEHIGRRAVVLRNDTTFPPRDGPFGQHRLRQLAIWLSRKDYHIVSGRLKMHVLSVVFAVIVTVVMARFWPLQTSNRAASHQRL